ncbi:MAG: hypothetical protein MK289_17885 [Trichodesmium sp. ALOHA_ZT_67]|uniref:hypothetical protein n=1 Tax=Trichodesmium erythraeum TaxID=1206 RepID=UPI0003236BAD|nr:hypothetical protein [Trichodesmium sp. ALOHA_ZT_67]MDE5095247.1 hypothetical protein [Trichodesmium sp. St11_bin5]
MLQPKNIITNQTPIMRLFYPQFCQLRYLIHTPLPLELLAGKSGTELIYLGILKLKKS